MFYRRKIILSLLQLFDGELEKIRLQKLLFLFTKKQEIPEYDFIPYKYGCFSYSANADLTTMVKQGLLTESEISFSKNDKIDYLKIINDNDRRLMAQLKLQFFNMTSDDLMKFTYIKFPYWARNSKKAKNILSPEQLNSVKNSVPIDIDPVLFTIGYEGLSLEEYLNRLIKNGVNLLIDVRKNPLSMKYGFSKTRLKACCESVNIDYIHFPQLGIESDERKELKTQADYDELFSDYRENSIPRTKEVQNEILSLIIKYKLIALTCFESNINQCHRKYLTEAISNLPGFEFEVKHI
ncbi:MAG: DUF488 domain-containing protein [Ignavibacteria bacterium]|nr:DUF488 domain-containing protein [Ignavibacteria bacterium]